MTGARLVRIGGLALVAGCVAVVVHLVARSVLTAGVDPAVSARALLWAPVNALGALGAALLLLGLPAAYARVAGAAGTPGLLGIVLVSLAWMFLGLFLGLYGALVTPWLATAAPALLAPSTPLSAGIVAAFVAALVSELAGCALLAVPFLRGRLAPRWVGLALPAAALLSVAGDLLAPSGPAASLPLNLLSNSGPAVLAIALARLGFDAWASAAEDGIRLVVPPRG